MKQETYTALKSSDDAFEFEFLSEGPKGSIEKVVQFAATSDPFIYSLAFGDKLRDRRIDDLARNDNKDMAKILSTVATTIYEFTLHHPECYVFFTGSNPARTRLYRMAITINYEELSRTFEIYGVEIVSGVLTTETFLKNKPYTCFLIKRKN